jgi:transglutaminase-like putative cysteine protease
MRFDIHHRTTYRYSAAVTLLPHRLLLIPRGSHELVVQATSIRCSPPATLSWTQDVFGNIIATATFAEPTTRLEILSDLSVEQMAAPWPVFDIAVEAQSFPFPYSAELTADLGSFRTPQYDDPSGEVAAWARGFVFGTVTDTLSLLKDINIGMLGQIAYRSREEAGTQSPEETLALRSGSCRDIAALFIEAVRHLGFGARAVSGYLFDPSANESTGQSTHAWAEVFLPGAGWIAFDPTHQRMGSAHLVPVAIGRSNPQIMPVTGEFLGPPDVTAVMEVEVSLTPQAA